jgi:hypothetical protein
VLARLLLLGGGSSFVTKTFALTSLGVSDPGDGASIPDSKFFGFGTDRFALPIGGSLDSTVFGAYTIAQLREEIVFNTVDNSFGTLLIRFVQLTLASGPAALAKTDFASMVCSGGQTLLTSASTFSPQSGGGVWLWTVNTNTSNETAPDYLPTGTVTLNG